jgi:signal transduction histidine kinase
MAHELNNPLGGMLSFLQLIRMDLSQIDPLRPDIVAMEEAALRCRDIILNLLGFARRQELEDMANIDLMEVVHRSIKLIELQSKSKGIQIRLKARTGPLPLKASPNALSQAICNLLQNSIEAIAEKMESEPLFPGEIQIEIHTEGQHYQIRITDNGLGIRSEHLSQVFTPLFTTKDPMTNSGLGLTLAYTIIQEHQGSLEILSQKGSGTSAILSLPRLEM